MRDKTKVGFRETYAGEKNRGLFAAERAAEALRVQEQVLAEMRRQTGLLVYVAEVLHRMETKG